MDSVLGQWVRLVEPGAVGKTDPDNSQSVR